jgi:hypothetical protein
MEPHEQGERHAHKDGSQRQEEILQADDFVVGGKGAAESFESWSASLQGAHDLNYTAMDAKDAKERKIYRSVAEPQPNPFLPRINAEERGSILAYH